VGAIIEKLEELEQPPVIRNGRLVIGLFTDTRTGLGWSVTGHGFQQRAVRIT